MTHQSPTDQRFLLQGKRNRKGWLLLLSDFRSEDFYIFCHVIIKLWYRIVAFYSMNKLYSLLQDPCWSLSSPREPRGQGTPPLRFSSEWHCNTKQEIQLEWVHSKPKANDNNQHHRIISKRNDGFEIRSYMISVSSQWELPGIISTFSMWRPMGLLSVLMQRQCSSTPRLLRLIPVRRKESHRVTKCITVFAGLPLHALRKRGQES